MRLHCLQHVPYEDMANIETWAKSRGHTVSYTHLYKGEELPLLGSFEWLVVMGGPMSAGDEAEYPWLKAEKRFIRSAVATGKIVLGVCLGAQLMAEAMGGKVGRNRSREIGWFPVKLTPEAKDSPIFMALPGEFMTFQWHGDTFSIPPGARRLAFSDACDDQAFEIGRAIGLQLHLECTEEGIERLIERCGGDLVKGPYVQDIAAIRAGYVNVADTYRTLAMLLDRIEKEYGRSPAETA